jgi:hypothetical protein
MPMIRHLRPDPEHTRPQAHAMGYRGGVRRREYSYRPQSTAAPLVTQGTKFIPSSARDIWLKAFSVN